MCTKDVRPEDIQPGTPENPSPSGPNGTKSHEDATKCQENNEKITAKTRFTVTLSWRLTFCCAQGPSTTTFSQKQVIGDSRPRLLGANHRSRRLPVTSSTPCPSTTTWRCRPRGRRRAANDSADGGGEDGAGDGDDGCDAERRHSHTCLVPADLYAGLSWHHLSLCSTGTRRRECDATTMTMATRTHATSAVTAIGYLSPILQHCQPVLTSSTAEGRGAFGGGIVETPWVGSSSPL